MKINDELFTKKDLFIKNQMKHLCEEDFSFLLYSIKEIDKSIKFKNNKKEKFNVWIFQEINEISQVQNRDVKEVFKEMEHDIIKILNWAYRVSPNITSFSFDEALEMTKTWAKQNPWLFFDIDKKRVVYQSSCGYFFYLLKASDLPYEGQHMGHCVGGENYKSKIKSKKALIISLRDTKNKPHVTIEISTLKNKKTKKVESRLIQQQGKQNRSIRPIYQEIINEFVCFICDKI